FSKRSETCAGSVTGRDRGSRASPTIPRFADSRRDPEVALNKKAKKWLLPVMAAGLIAVAAGAFVALRSGQSVTGGGGSKQPDIILVTIDTLRTDAVSFTGSKRSSTPF